MDVRDGGQGHESEYKHGRKPEVGQPDREERGMGGLLEPIPAASLFPWHLHFKTVSNQLATCLLPASELKLTAQIDQHKKISFL